MMHKVTLTLAVIYLLFGIFDESSRDFNLTACNIFLAATFVIMQIKADKLSSGER